MSKTTKRASAPKTGQSLADNAKVQDRHRAIARQTLTESRSPDQILKTSQERALQTGDARSK